MLKEGIKAKDIAVTVVEKNTAGALEVALNSLLAASADTTVYDISFQQQGNKFSAMVIAKQYSPPYTGKAHAVKSYD